MRVLSMVVCKQSSYSQWRRQSLRVGLTYVGVVILLCNLAILLSACSSIFSTPSQSGGSSTPDTTDSAPTATPVVSPTANYVPPTIALQVIGACPSVNWDSLVGAHAKVNKVQKVICGSLEGAGTLQALIDVRYYSPEAKLDVYVYDNLFGTPFRRFSVQGLLNGDALISSVGTLTTAEISPKDTVKGARDLFKEYQWNGATFVQILFPGMFPDMTRYQAEQDQAMVNAELAAVPPGQSSGQIRDAWKLVPGAVASHLAQSIFHWQPANYTVTLPPNARKLTVFTLTVTNLAAGGGGFIVTLHHLNEVPTNIFEIWQVSSIDGNSALSSPSAYARLTSPVNVSGSSLASGSILGQVVFYDDVYTNVGSSGPIRSSTSTGYVEFANSVRYQLNAQGLEEGVVAFYPTNQNNAAISNQAILVKVFLSS